MKIALVAISLSIIVNCNQKLKPRENSSFITDVKSYLNKHYILNQEKQFDVSKKDSLRADFFYSDSLISAIMYGFLGIQTDSLDSNRARFGFSFYEYTSIDSAVRVVKDIEMLNKNSIKEGLYGPISKDFHFFLQATNFVLHFGGDCRSAEEKEWKKLRDSLVNITVKHFNTKPFFVSKPCE